MKTFEGDLVLTENTIFKEDIEVNGDIRCKGGLWDISADNIKARNVDVRDLNVWDVDVGELNARDVDAWDIYVGKINARNINFFAFAIARQSFKCKSWKSRRNNYIAKCLDGEIEIIKSKFCDKCGQPLKE